MADSFIGGGEFGQFREQLNELGNFVGDRIKAASSRMPSPERTATLNDGRELYNAISTIAGIDPELLKTHAVLKRVRKAVELLSKKPTAAAYNGQLHLQQANVQTMGIKDRTLTTIQDNPLLRDGLGKLAAELKPKPRDFWKEMAGELGVTAVGRSIQRTLSAGQHRSL